MFCNVDSFVKNSRNRSHLVVKGLGQVGSSGAQRDQVALRSRMTSVLQLVGIRTQFSVLNVVVFPSATSPVYDVEIEPVEAVDLLVREFFKFVRRQDPVRRPPELDRVSIHHSVTPGTRIRISLLRVRIVFVSFA